MINKLRDEVSFKTENFIFFAGCTVLVFEKISLLSLTGLYYSGLC